MEKRYTLSFDMLSIFLSILFFAIVATIISLSLYNFFGKHQQPNIIEYIVVAILAIAGGITYVFKPKFYSIDPSSIHIVTACTTIEIPKNEIQQIKLIDTVNPLKRLKLFSSGGVFGYIGYYLIPNYGKALSFASRLDKQILLQLPNVNTSFLRMIFRCWMKCKS